MQGNGFKIFVTAAFLVLCVYSLYPSVQNYFISQKIDDLQGDARVRYETQNADYIQEVKGESLKLGLDLLGGMHVTLQVQVPALVSELAQDKDDTFDAVLQQARARVEETGSEDFVGTFVGLFEERDPDARLSRYFFNQEGIDRRSSNADVAAFLNAEVDEAVGRGMEIIRNRVDRYGVTEPSIQRQGTRRIVVELPGVEDQERVRGLLRGTARLEFRLMADPQQLAQSAERINAYFEQAADQGGTPAGDSAAALPAPADTAAADTAAADTAAATGTRLTDAEAQDTSAGAGTRLTEEEAAPTTALNPLLARLQPAQPGGSRLMPYGPSVVFAFVAERDTAAVNELLSRPAVQRLLPRNIELMYSANPLPLQNPVGFELLGVRGGEAELTGDVVTDASTQFDRYTNEPKVSITMNSEGARIWSRLTAANVGKPFAIVLDGFVYSYPSIRERIMGGRSEISGLESRAEAADIVNILKSGALPAPVDIVEERTVGPSLGQESIQAGLTSVLVGLLIVALFMIFYYRTAGVVADLALLLNVVFIFGILAGFNATLTLPGIAGIVLTIGMAVDANVLIFERVREEQATGKTMRAAIDAGYAKALSAILDANITTFFVGAILFSFGVGPIQGFAVTLMAGILSSMFTAIVFTRIIIDYMVAGRGMAVNYG